MTVTATDESMITALQALAGEAKRLLVVGSAGEVDQMRAGVEGPFESIAIDASGSLERVPPAAAFDAALIATPLEQLDSVEQILDALRSSLSADGVLIASALNAGSLRIRLSLLEGELPPEIAAARRRLTLESLEDLLAAHGYLVTRIERIREKPLRDEGRVPSAAFEALARTPEADVRRFVIAASPLAPEAAAAFVKSIRSARSEESQTREREQALRARLDRFAAGALILRQLLFRESERRQRDVAERDATIVAQQAELFQKVVERDRLIRDLQGELHAKVGERDELIVTLQSELRARDESIETLTSELASREETIERLRSELESARTESRRVTPADGSPLPEPGDAHLSELQRTRRERDELEAALRKIHGSRSWKLMGVYWRMIARLKGKR